MVDFLLYLITDERIALEPWRVEAALAGAPRGAAAIQLRAKSLGAGDLLAAARALRPITRAHGALLFVNDRVDVALASGADGVHLPLAGLAPADAKRLAPALLVGASTHDLAEATRAAAGGADFVTFGPVFATPSKRHLGAPVGLAALAAAARVLTVPLFALGGIDHASAPGCVASGARLACIRAVLAAPDPTAAATALHRLVTV